MFTKITIVIFFVISTFIKGKVVPNFKIYSDRVGKVDSFLNYKKTEQYTKVFNCIRIFTLPENNEIIEFPEDGVWGSVIPAKVNVIVNYGKNIILIINGNKKTYKCLDLLADSDIVDDARVNIFRTTYNGKTFLFEFTAADNLWVKELTDRRIIKFSCN